MPYTPILAINTNTCNKYLYMPVLTIHTYTHQYTPIQIQTNTCNTYQYMQYKQLQCNTYQYIIHANTCKYISIPTYTYHTYQYMHLYSSPNTNLIHTQYIPSMYLVCIELSIQTLEFNTNQYILGKPLMYQNISIEIIA